MSIEQAITKAVVAATEPLFNQITELKASIEELSAIKPLKFYTVQEVADKMNVDPKTVSNWCRDGKLPYTKPGGTITRIEHADLMNFLERKDRR